ncbi:unnamed protein product [Allacma fusca]|uniref:Nodal modulator 3 n=1 Tax=Allacma fusca TaxID=39272 RepID=A0A8J2PN13_9HEXA|nr:unnamed protein product [Allacma fusca]
MNRDLSDFLESSRRAGRMKFVIVTVLALAIPMALVQGQDPGKIHGCGGFVRSPYKLEFHQIEIKLYTKQGSLTMKTDCAPTTGYYFIPLERLGDYVLKISPPEGWTFDPPEYQIRFDGKTDVCSKEVDLNFDFKGFSIYGQVSSAGHAEGPSGVQVDLTGPHDLRLTATTEKKGAFSFERIPPGQYVVKASHPDLVFENDKYSFEITNKNIVIEKELRIRGYVVTGQIFSDSRPVEGVSFVLYGKPGTRLPSNCLASGDKVEFGKDSNEVYLCQRLSDSSGTFQFTGVSPGVYSIVPIYKGKNIIYTVTPEKLNFEVKHESLKLKTNFQEEGFTMKGVVKEVGAGAVIFVNGKQVTTTGEDGSFSIAKMKPGTFEFKIQSDEFQFDPVKVDVSAGDPNLPVFTPSRFLVCGTITGSSSSSVTLEIRSVDKDGKQGVGVTKSEVVQNPLNHCTFLPPGTYNAWIGSLPNAFFLPSKLSITVPSAQKKAFEFKQFLGRISGVINCNFACPEGVTINLASNGKHIKQVSLKGSAEKMKFSFEEMESGSYAVSVESNKYCWENDGTLDVTLKDTNIENLSINQQGFRLVVVSSHDTRLKIAPSGEELGLKARGNVNLCLKSANLHTLTPTSCHIFEKSEYQIKPGQVTELELKAVKHLISGSVISKEKIDDLKVKVNGDFLNEGKVIEGKKTSASEFEYKVEFGEAPDKVLTVKFSSVGFSFEPPEIMMTTLEACQPNSFQARALKAHIIKGKLIPALEDVHIRVDLLGDTSEPIYVTSDAKGEYIAGPFIHSSGFQVTPSKPGYTFKQLPGDEFSFSVHQLAKIQVKVAQDTPGEALSNVLLSLSGPNAYRQNRYTDSNGEMTFTDLQAGQYYLKALLKEFRFEPSAVNIQLQEQETKLLTVTAIRESFSLYGQLFSLNGDLMPNLFISAKGTGSCSEYGEEGISDEYGNFRIWALKSSCTYIVSVASNDDKEGNNKVERTIPTSLEVLVGQEDIKNVSFMVMTPVTRMDISLRCHTNKDIYLDSLKVFVYSTRSPDMPLHRASFNGYPFLILPQIPKDGSEYFITFEANNLSETQFKYKLPNVINFVANESFAHYSFQFNVEPAPVEQDIGKSSYIAMTTVFLVIIASMYFDKITKLVRAYIESNANNLGSSSRKTKVKSK